jgi:hypothetical protein
MLSGYLGDPRLLQIGWDAAGPTVGHHESFAANRQSHCVFWKLTELGRRSSVARQLSPRPSLFTQPQRELSDR